jgi:hypothetical protein
MSDCRARLATPATGFDHTAVTVTVLVRTPEGRIIGVDRHVRVVLPSACDTWADVIVASDEGPCTWARACARARESALRAPGALVTLVPCRPTLALVRIGAAPPGRVRRRVDDPPWPVFASVVHAAIVHGSIPHGSIVHVAPATGGDDGRRARARRWGIEAEPTS